MSPEVQNTLRYLSMMGRGASEIIPGAPGALGNLEIRQLCAKLKLTPVWDEEKHEFVVTKEGQK